ncbi:hypothetical protein CHELA1G11_10436 [Hyphomicrobiales bacterium]|nr:hypothetical protein CHELA1G11_10436 [Hyphomicrobiales bacterium]CAH1674687.1 hypothetical protein CHELA1G2_13868 [Hyphomicrobiales bacterium]
MMRVPGQARGHEYSGRAQIIARLAHLLHVYCAALLRDLGAFLFTAAPYWGDAVRVAP